MGTSHQATVWAEACFSLFPVRRSVFPNFRAPADAFDVIVARVWARAQQADPELTTLAKKAARL